MSQGIRLFLCAVPLCTLSLPANKGKTGNLLSAQLLWARWAACAMQPCVQSGTIFGNFSPVLQFKYGGDLANEFLLRCPLSATLIKASVLIWPPISTECSSHKSVHLNKAVFYLEEDQETETQNGSTARDSLCSLFSQRCLNFLKGWIHSMAFNT